jgi:hypothetical protein
MLLVSAQLVLGGYYSKKLALGLVSITSALHLYQHYSTIMEKHEGYSLCVLGVGCWPVRSLCSLASWSTLPSVNNQPVLQAKFYEAYGSTVLGLKDLTYC